MKRILFLFVAITLSFFAAGQTIGHFRFDSTRLYKVGGNNELILENATRGTTGLLYNYFNGRTKFVKPIAVPGGIAFGDDTVAVAGGTGNDNLNQGAGYRWLVPSTQAIKTVFAGTNVTIDSTTNPTGITISSTGGSGTDNANEGAGFRLVIPSNQRIKTLYSGTNVTIDSTTNPTGITISASGGSGTDNANAGTGYRLVKPSDQTVKTLFNGDGITIDSVTNANGLTIFTDTVFLNSKYSLVVENVVALRALAGPFTEGQSVRVLGHTIKDDGGGGIYTYYDTAAATDDNGGIIKPNLEGGAGRWIHRVDNGIVNLKWWGIVPLESYTAQYDIKDEIDSAFKFMRRNSQWTKLYIPADTSGFDGAYYCATTVQIDDRFTIFGDGQIGKPLTRIQWPDRVKCVYIPYLASDGALNTVNMTNLEIYQIFTASDYGDTTAHGIHARGKVRLDNITVSFATGNGFHLEGCAVPEDPLEGNVDNSELLHCTANFVNHGLFLDGCDANRVTIYKFDASTVRRWGVFDNGMLGNYYQSPHFAFCGSASGSNVVVTYGGKYYVPICPDDTVTTGKSPLLRPDLWEEVTAMTSSAWDTTKRYWSGGVYNIQNANAWTTIIDPYSEGFQPPARLNTRTLQLNGTQGVPTKGGSNLKVLFGQLFTLNSDLMLPGETQRIGLGDITEGIAQGRLHIVNNFTITGQSDLLLLQEKGGSTAYMRFKNNANANGLLGYSGTSFIFYPNSTFSTQISPTEIAPGSDSAIDNGLSNLRWKNIHGVYGNLRELRLNGTTSGTVTLRAPATVTDWTLRVPTAAPVSDGLVLTGNMDGSTSWTAASGSGTVTNIETGFGLDGGPITTTGTIVVDTFEIATRARLQKVIDSLPTGGTSQWTTTGNNIYYDDGKVGIGFAGTPAGYLNVAPTPTLGATDSLITFTATTSLGTTTVFNQHANGGFVWKNHFGNTVWEYNVASEFLNAGIQLRTGAGARFTGDVLIGNLLRGIVWADNKINLDNAWGPVYSGSGDGGSDLNAHRFTVAAAMTGTNSNLASFDNNGSSRFAIGKDGELKMAGSTSGTTGIKAAATVTSYSLTFPDAAPPSDGQVIAYTTGGVGSWVSPGGGTPNANVGAGFRVLKPGTQEIKTLFAGTNITIDSTNNTDGITISASGGTGTPNANAGTGYRWLKPDDQAIKTLFGVNLTVDSTTNSDGLTVTADTLLLATRAWRQKGIDSLMAVIPGTVTSVATSAGTGIVGGTITSSGTISADTLLLGTRAWRQKGIDSLSGVINVIKNSKGITLTSPTSTENIVVYRTTEAITVDSVMTVMIGTTPSVTFVLNYGASRSTADGTIVASNTFDTGDANYNTTGFSHTLNTTTIPGGSYIWFTTSAVSGTINDFNLQIIFR